MAINSFFGKSDSDLFGGLFEVIGGFLISIGILKFIETLELKVLNVPFIIGGLGYLFFSLGFYIKTRNKGETFRVCLYLALVLGLITFLWGLIQINL